MHAISLLLLYGVTAAIAAGAAAWLGRRIPPRWLAAFFLLPLAFLFSGFFLDKTILPVDHARLIAPWSEALPGAVRYNPNLDDAATQFAPWAKAVRMAWKEGSLPFRNRWNGCGTPLSANGQSAAFAPWTILLFAVPLASSFNVLVAWKLFFALCGTWLWLKELGLRDVSAGFGAIAFALSFTMTPWLLFPQTSAIALFPWILFGIERLRDARRSGRALAALAALLTVWPLSGHIESVASFSLLALFWLAVRVALRDFPKDARIWSSMAFAAALALALSAFALVPHAFAILASNRIVFARNPFWSRVFSSAPHPPFWPGILLTLFPRSFGDAIGAPMLPASIGSFSEVGLGYFGLVGAACALLFARPGSRRPRSETALLAPVAFGLFAGTAVWPFGEVAGLLPVFRWMFPLRWLSWVAFSGSALAAFELDRLIRDRDRDRRGAVWLAGSFGLLAALATWWFIGNRAAYEATGALRAQERALALSLLAAGAGLIGSGAASLSARARTALPLLLIGILTAELFWQGRRLYRFGAPEELFPQTPLIAFLHSRPQPFRVVGEGAALFPGSNIFAGVEDVRTHDPVERADYVRFLDGCCGYDATAYFKQLRDVNSPALDFLNVRYLVSAPGRVPPGQRWTRIYSGADGTVFENPRAHPRLFSEDGSDPVEIASYRETANRVDANFHAPARSAVAIRTSFVEDGGWSVRDGSGRLLEKSTAHAPFLSFELPAGQTRVRLAYSPPGFFAGSAVSLSALAAVLAWAISRRIRERRRRAAAPGGESDLSRP